VTNDMTSAEERLHDHPTYDVSEGEVCAYVARYLRSTSWALKKGGV